MKHLLACLVLFAVLQTILVAATGEVEVGGLEDLLVATAPEGAGVCIYSIVGGLADEAEGSDVLVRCEVGGNVLVELCKRCQHALRSIGAMAEGKGFTSIGRASKPFQAMLSAGGIACCGDGMWSCLLDGLVVDGKWRKGCCGQRTGKRVWWCCEEAAKQKLISYKPAAE